MEEDRRAKVIAVAEAEGTVLDRLNPVVHPFAGGAGDPMVEVGQHVAEVPSKHRRPLAYRLQARPGRPPVPAAEVPQRPTATLVPPQVAQHLLQRPGPSRL